MSIAPDDSRLFDPGKAEVPSLADRFGAPPFTVLNTRQGYWRDRRRQWESTGMASEDGRDHVTTWGDDVRVDPVGAKMLAGGSVSEFDPVLCELIYRWFTAPGDTILDPFAGGSVRGIVASALGRWYTGIDVRPEQIDANNRQASDILDDDHLAPTWVEGDAADIDTLLDASDDGYNLLFSCPPYGDLERYSDDPRDLSTMDYRPFIDAYRTIIAATAERLAPDSFACFVVGDIRDKRTGNYRNFVGDTITAFLDAGLSLYNEAVVVAGSTAAMRTRQFTASRKLVKTHQNVLVFAKGDARAAADRLGDVEMGGAS